MCVRRGKGSVAPRNSERVWIFSWSLLNGTAERVFVRCVATHRTNSNWIWIHCTSFMTTCRVLYLSDSPGRNQICWEFSPTGASVRVSEMYSRRVVTRDLWQRRVTTCLEYNSLSLADAHTHFHVHTYILSFSLYLSLPISHCDTITLTRFFFLVLVNRRDYMHGFEKLWRVVNKRNLGGLGCCKGLRAQ